MVLYPYHHLLEPIKSFGFKVSLPWSPKTLVPRRLRLVGGKAVFGELYTSTLTSYTTARYYLVEEYHLPYIYLPTSSAVGLLLY